MFPMDPSAYPGIAFANPDAATALATMALVDVTNNLVIVGLIVGLGQIAAIVYGIWSMNQSGKRREAQHDKRLKATLDALATERATSEHRHREAIEADRKRHDEAMERLRQSSKALDTLILRTTPGRRPPRTVTRNRVRRAAA